MTEFCIVMTTTGATDDAHRLSRLLVERRLAACIQILPMTSLYRWEGRVVTDSEQLLLVKTRSALYDEAERCIRDNHPYEVPEVVRVPIEAGSTDYLDWMRAVTADATTAQS